MQDIHPTEQPTLTEENELYWRIYAPKTRRIMTLIGHRSGAEPRLWLMDACDGHGPDSDILWIGVPEDISMNDLWGRYLAGAWDESHRPTLLRAGTWGRYQQDVAHVRLVAERLGWELTDEEESLMAALEEYGRKAPARYQTAA